MSDKRAVESTQVQTGASEMRMLAFISRVCNALSLPLTEGLPHATHHATQGEATSHAD